MRDILSKLDALISETALKDKEDLEAKRRALDDLEADPIAGNDPQISAAIDQRRSDLEKEAQAKGFTENEDVYQVGDDFGISFSEDFEVGAEIVDILEDGIVVELDETALAHLSENGFTFEEIQLDEEKQKGVDGKACWKGYKRMGTKMKSGKRVDNCVKMSEDLDEDLGSFKAAGIPDDFSRGLLKSVNLSNDAEIEPINGVPKAADFNSGIVINVLPDGDVIGMLKGDGRYGKIYQRMTMSGGKFQRNNVDNTKDAVKGMKKSGKFYKIDRNWFGGISRREKPSTDPADVKDRTTSDALAGSNEEIYSYMNDTFMPKMKQQMEAMVDDIYANLRKLGNSRDNFRGSKTEQQQALDMAKAIESIADRGFSRSTMELFLRSMDKEHHGFASIPNNERELRDILKNEPNARAKWAKTVLDAAKAQHDAVKNMIAAPVMKGLKGEDLDEAEYQGRKVPLGKPMAGDVKKSKVYVKNPQGNVVKVNFGDKKMRIKKSNPNRRKNFRARHNCANPGPRHKARYWSCRAW